MAKAPSFWKAEEVGIRRRPDLTRAKEEGLAAGLNPAAKDKVKRIVVGIDYQIDFVFEDGSLKVERAIDDLRRFIDYLYGNAEEISGLLFSLDQHIPWQIFYSLWWRDRNGKHPEPFTVITRESVGKGEWLPRLEKEWSRNYPAELEKTGQSPLIVWPEHCMAGTEGANLIPELAEAIIWLSAARTIQPIYMFKGTVPKSEHYGPFCCCVPVDDHPQGGLQTQFMDIIASYDVIDLAGEAEDFCVREGMRQLLNYYGDRPEAIEKMRFLRDCTSPVFPDKRDEADNILDDFAGQGVQIVKSTDLVG